MEITYRKETYGQYSVDVFTIYQFGELMYKVCYRHLGGMDSFVTEINEYDKDLLEYFYKYSANESLAYVATKLNYSYDKLVIFFLRDYINVLNENYK